MAGDMALWLRTLGFNPQSPPKKNTLYSFLFTLSYFLLSSFILFLFSVFLVTDGTSGAVLVGTSV